MTTAVILVAVGVLGPAVAIAVTPAGRRRAVTVGHLVWGLLVVAAGVVFALVTDGVSLDAADAPVLGWMVAHRTPGWTALAEGLAFWGGTAFTGGLGVVSGVVLVVRGHRVPGLCWILAVGAGAGTIRLLKFAVERPRPPEASRLAVETTASLPSGHSLQAALGLGLSAAAIVLLTPGARPALHRLAVVVAVVLALAIGVSRAYLGVHWTTDVLAGWLLGAALATLAVTVARGWAPVGERSGGSAAPAASDGAPAAADTGRPVDPPSTAGRPVDPSHRPVDGAADEGAAETADRRSIHPTRWDAP